MMKRRLLKDETIRQPAATLQSIIDRAEIGATAARFVRALDGSDWALLRSCLPDEVEADYPGLTGGRGLRFKADDFVSLLRCLLEGSNSRSRHLSGNHTVEIRGDEATCTSYYVTHPERRAGVAELSIAHGYHRNAMTRTFGGWKIRRITARNTHSV